jgi:nitrogen fixation NifU-like protein
MYSPLVLDHFEHPRNSGELPQPTRSATVENPACGDILELSVRIEQGIIAAIGFRAQGCVPTVACASRLTEMVQGKPVAEALSIPRQAIIESLGGLPSASQHAAQLAVDALRTVLGTSGPGSDATER